MDSDLYLVIGLIVSGLAIPPIVGALVDGRVPRTAAIMIMIGGGLISISLMQKPSGYSFQEIPKAFVNVAAKYLQ